ncbi:hypothetical protein PCE1_001842 [Barthelona sp. PCE]
MNSRHTALINSINKKLVAQEPTYDSSLVSGVGKQDKELYRSFFQSCCAIIDDTSSDNILLCVLQYLRDMVDAIGLHTEFDAWRRALLIFIARKNVVIRKLTVDLCIDYAKYQPEVFENVLQLFLQGSIVSEVFERFIPLLCEGQISKNVIQILFDSWFEISSASRVITLRENILKFYYLMLQDITYTIPMRIVLFFFTNDNIFESFNRINITFFEKVLNLLYDLLLHYLFQIHEYNVNNDPNNDFLFRILEILLKRNFSRSLLNKFFVFFYGCYPLKVLKFLHNFQTSMQQSRQNDHFTIKENLNCFYDLLNNSKLHPGILNPVQYLNNELFVCFDSFGLSKGKKQSKHVRFSVSMIVNFLEGLNDKYIPPSCHISYIKDRNTLMVESKKFHDENTVLKEKMKAIQRTNKDLLQNYKIMEERFTDMFANIRKSETIANRLKPLSPKQELPVCEKESRKPVEKLDIGVQFCSVIEDKGGLKPIDRDLERSRSNSLTGRSIIERRKSLHPPSIQSPPTSPGTFSHSPQNFFSHDDSLVMELSTQRNAGIISLPGSSANNSGHSFNSNPSSSSIFGASPIPQTTFIPTLSTIRQESPGNQYVKNPKIKRKVEKFLKSQGHEENEFEIQPSMTEQLRNIRNKDEEDVIDGESTSVQMRIFHQSALRTIHSRDFLIGNILSRYLKWKEKHKDIIEQNRNLNIRVENLNREIVRLKTRLEESEKISSTVQMLAKSNKK